MLTALRELSDFDGKIPYRPTAPALGISSGATAPRLYGNLNHIMSTFSLFAPSLGTAPEEPQHNRLGIKAFTGVALAATLALTACGGDDEDEDPNGNGEDEASTEEDTTEEDTDGEDSDEEAGEDEIPSLSEIQSASLETIDSAESLTVEGSGDGLGMDLEALGQQLGAEDVDELGFHIEGNLDESAPLTSWVIGFGDNSMEVVIDGQDPYMNAETFAPIFESQLAADGIEFDTEGFAAEIEGYWVDMTGALPPEDMHLTDLLANLAEPIEGSDAGMEASAGTHEGQDAWIYSDAEGELTFLADADSPYLLNITGIDPASDESFSMEFSEWDSTELPEVPAEDEVLSDQELNSLAEQYVSF